MYRFFLLTLFVSLLGMSLYAENNTTQENNTSKEHNNSVKLKQKKDTSQTVSKSKLTEAQVKEQMEREKKYAKEQKFYQGDEYDLKAVEINKKSLEHVPVIEPDYDFDITDVYRDDL
ncbi:hypothetical protein [Sulfurovum sp.]|uniref:hypothetical protein n=1 Tax=Sulfurovum sp. TaxID=1969726 RepID=UPI0025E909FB|nr:hypothetical protein [Sulfurovum sp.]